MNIQSDLKRKYEKQKILVVWFFKDFYLKHKTLRIFSLKIRNLKKKIRPGKESFSETFALCIYVHIVDICLNIECKYMNSM